METPVVQNPTKVATKWAFIYALTAIVITYAFQFLNVDPTSPLKYITYVPFIAFLMMAQKEYRDVTGGYISFGDAFSTGFRFSLFAGLLIAVFSYLYLAILSPGVWDKVLDSTRTQLEAKNMSSAQIDQAMAITKKWGPLIGAFGAAIAYAIFGAVLSLIGAAIFKKERSPYDIAQSAIDPADEV
ncbi:MAG: DUF4199 domain-containing protein [Mucilaginibacter sp.]